VVGGGRWRGGEVEKWRSGEVERWRGGEVERWRGGEVERWRGRGQQLYGLSFFSTSLLSTSHVAPLCCL
jgi:hypothetical protein